MKIGSRRIIALLLLLVTIAGLVVSFGENAMCAGEMPGTHQGENASSLRGTEQINDCACPPAPSLPDSTDDHLCTGDCGCPCQAPLSPTSLIVTHSRSFTSLYHVEPARYIPEVYLSLTVPPDSPAI